MILIRHGESTWNQERRIQGNLDPGLSVQGKAQAELLAARLKGRAFAALYTSPLRRALDTAAILGESAGLAPRSINGLREIRLGEWEGKTATEIRTASGDLYDRWLDRPLDVSLPPGGEEIRAFQQRAVDAIDSLRRSHIEGDVLVVTHGGVIKVYLCHILGLDLNRLFRIKADNTAVTEILFNGDTAHLALLNDTCHLNGQGIAVPTHDGISGGDHGPAHAAS
jgi:broad specificity phosphatase PhoE